MTALPAPSATTGHASCTVSTQALCCGPLETSVFGVTGSRARRGERAHIGIKFGRILFYLEDRQALVALGEAVRQAEGMADAVYGPVRDTFADAEAQGRRRFERTGDVAQLG